MFDSAEGKPTTSTVVFCSQWTGQDLYCVTTQTSLSTQSKFCEKFGRRGVTYCGLQQIHLSLSSFISAYFHICKNKKLFPFMFCEYFVPNSTAPSYLGVCQ